jgi:hypothetical protein
MMANNQPFLAQLAKQVATSECSSEQVMSIDMANVGYSGGRRVIQTIQPGAHGDMIPSLLELDSMHMYSPQKRY